MTEAEKMLLKLMKGEAHSEAIKAGIQQSMRAGKVKLNYSQFLGYTKDADGNLVVVPEEAAVVRKIFELYLQGNGCRKIKRYLEGHGIKTVTGKAEWSTSTIDRMLSSEKYIGDLLLQKTFTAGARGHQVQNNGQQAMYYVENNHEPIIDRDIWMQVQERKGIPLPEYMQPIEPQEALKAAARMECEFGMSMC